MKTMKPHTISRLCKAFVLVLMMVACVDVEAQTHTKAVELEQDSQHAKTIGQVKNYVCPMHPDIKSTKPGKCPKCKMDLRLERPAAVTVNQNLIAGSAVAESVSLSPKSTDDTIPRSTVSSGGTRMVIPDVEVLDQNGNALHFYRDLIKGKTVAINFIFTNCTTICPPLAATFARVQREMGDKVGRDVHFISISVDPLTDTPERLKAWGAKFKAGDGWTFVTGDKQEMDKLLNALGALVSRREDHTPSVIIGNDVKGVWTRTYGLAKTSLMVGLILDVIEGKVDESVTKETVKP